MVFHIGLGWRGHLKLTSCFWLLTTPQLCFSTAELLNTWALWLCLSGIQASVTHKDSKNEELDSELRLFSVLIYISFEMSVKDDFYEEPNIKKMADSTPAVSTFLFWCRIDFMEKFRVSLWMKLSKRRPAFIQIAYFTLLSVKSVVINVIMDQGNHRTGNIQQPAAQQKHHDFTVLSYRRQGY